MLHESLKTKTVMLEDLNQKMLIQAYTGFSTKYDAIDDQTCEWLKLNFKGTAVAIGRQGKKLEVGIEKLQPGDTLYRISKFPSKLEKLVIVNSKLVKELSDRGFSRFEVRLRSPAKTSVQIKREESVREAGAFIEKVKESIKVRENTTDAIEALMDNSRKGKADTKEVMECVDNIIGSKSTDAISAIANLKESDQTYAHCVDVGAIFHTCYINIIKNISGTNVFDSKQQVLLSSFLHDFGKAKVPKEIIDSTARFDRDSKEMQMIQKHPDYGAEMLTKMNMPNHIVKMAHYHHVKLDPTMKSSYPEGVKFENVPLEARLIAIIDIYQALVGKRSYKKSWAPPAAMKFIDTLAGIEYDLDIWSAFLRVMGRYPKGSAVELNDGSQAFVISVPETDLDRPQVVIVRNAEGEDLKHHTFIDLTVEKDISITKELDNYETFGPEVVDIFTSLQVI